MESSKLKVTARSPEDLLAAVPLVLGFTPTDSLVMVTFGPAPPFHGRVDLPDRPRDVREVTAILLRACARHHVEQVMLVGYCEDVQRVERVLDRVRTGFQRAGIEVIARLAADGRHWWRLPRRHGEPGTAYDVAAHPFAAEAVWRGLVTHTDRAALAASLGPDPVAVERTTRALQARGPLQGSAAEAAWSTDLVRSCRASGSPPDDDAIARLVAGMTDLTVRDAVWFTLSRRDAQACVDFWTDVVRRCPLDHIAGPAAVLGFAAWVAGHGALAQCAIDRAREGDPGYSLAGLLSEVLEAALPPSAWDRISGRDADEC